jgi:hypothetical protein
VRPLLAVWPEAPRVAHGSFPRPEHVYRSDEDVTDLLSFAGAARVHEAWVDTGPRRPSKPRWVAADAGIALPQRTAVLGRWYVSRILRAERPDEAKPLTIREPAPELEVVCETRTLPGSFGKALFWRVLVTSLAAIGAYFLFS